MDWQLEPEPEPSIPNLGKMCIRDRARVGILSGEGQRAGTDVRQTAGAGKDAPEGDVGGRLVIV